MATNAAIIFYPISQYVISVAGHCFIISPICEPQSSQYQFHLSAGNPKVLAKVDTFFYETAFRNIETYEGKKGIQG